MLLELFHRYCMVMYNIHMFELINLQITLNHNLKHKNYLKKINTYFLHMMCIIEWNFHRLHNFLNKQCKFDWLQRILYYIIIHNLSLIKKNHSYNYHMSLKSCNIRMVINSFGMNLWNPEDKFLKDNFLNIHYLHKIQRVKDLLNNLNN